MSAPASYLKEVCLSLFKDNERLNIYCISLTCTSPGLKRNCLLRLDFSMVSISVTNSCPASLQAKPIMAKFLRCSHPIAPAPTCSNNNNNNIKTLFSKELLAVASCSHRSNYCNAYFAWQMLASKASTTTPIIAKKLEQEQKIMEGVGGGEICS